MLEPSVDTAEDCECESKPGDEEGSCSVGDDVKVCPEPEDGMEALVGGEDEWLSGEGDEASVVWGVEDGDGTFVELAGGDEALDSGKEFGVFDDKGGEDIGVLNGRDKEIGDGRDKEVGLFDDGGVEEVGGSDEEGGKETGMFDDNGELGVSDDAGDEEIGVSDGGAAEEVGAFDERGGKETGIFDDKGEVGVSDDRGGEEAGVFDEGAAEEVGVSDTEGTIHRPRRSTPRGHVTVGGEEVEGVEGGWDD